jgi:two-component system sensor histidine kinase/response regulator
LNPVAPGYADIPVIAMTGLALISDREKLIQLGLMEYLSKPYSGAELMNLFARYLGVPDEQQHNGETAASGEDPHH